MKKILILMLFINGCVLVKHPCNYKLSNLSIKTNCDLINGVTIEKLKNITELEGNVPSKYDIEYSVHYTAKSVAAMEDNMNLKELFFKKEIKGYKWNILGSDSSVATFPYEFEKNNWYIFSDLYENGIPSVRIFVYVNDNGSFDKYRRDFDHFLP